MYHIETALTAPVQARLGMLVVASDTLFIARLEAFVG